MNLMAGPSPAFVDVNTRYPSLFFGVNLPSDFKNVEMDRILWDDIVEFGFPSRVLLPAADRWV